MRRRYDRDRREVGRRQEIGEREGGATIKPTGPSAPVYQHMPNTTTALPATELASCPLCDANSKVVFSKYGYPIRDCLACGHRFAGVMPSSGHLNHVYGDDYFTAGASRFIVLPAS